VQIHQNTKAARRLLARLLRKQGRPPKRIITDKLGSYAAAKREVMPKIEQLRFKAIGHVRGVKKLQAQTTRIRVRWSFVR
jgi:putative transposase